MLPRSCPLGAARHLPDINRVPIPERRRAAVMAQNCFKLSDFILLNKD
jgi:hypothetical protein